MIYNNRRNGFHIRSAGITVENVTINFNGQSGMRYNPSLSALEQNDIVSWLSLKEQPELEANNIFRIPDQQLDLIEVMESNLNQRKFLVAAETQDCPAGKLNLLGSLCRISHSRSPSRMCLQPNDPISWLPIWPRFKNGDPNCQCAFKCFRRGRHFHRGLDWKIVEREEGSGLCKLISDRVILKFETISVSCGLH